MTYTNLEITYLKRLQEELGLNVKDVVPTKKGLKFEYSGPIKPFLMPKVVARKTLDAKKYEIARKISNYRLTRGLDIYLVPVTDIKDLVDEAKNKPRGFVDKIHSLYTTAEIDLLFNTMTFDDLVKLEFYVDPILEEGSCVLVPTIPTKEEKIYIEDTHNALDELKSGLSDGSVTKEGYDIAYGLAKANLDRLGVAAIHTYPVIFIVPDKVKSKKTGRQILEIKESVLEPPSVVLKSKSIVF